MLLLLSLLLVSLSLLLCFSKITHFLQVNTSQLLVLFLFHLQKNLEVLWMIVPVTTSKLSRKSSNPSQFPDYSRWDQGPAFIIVSYYITVDHLPFKNVLLSAKSLKRYFSNVGGALLPPGGHLGMPATLANISTEGKVVLLD